MYFHAEFKTKAYEKYYARERGYTKLLHNNFISFEVYVRLFHRNRITYEFKKELAAKGKYCMQCDRKIARCEC